MGDELIKKTPIYAAFSDRGKRLALPQGVFYWSGRAKREAEINATIGSARGPEKEFLGRGEGESVFYLPSLKDFFADSVSPGDVFPYAPIEGLPAFREAWRKWILRKLSGRASALGVDLERNISTPVVFPGLTPALYAAGSLFLNPGDTVVLPQKRWGNYDNIFSNNLGAEISSFRLFRQGLFDSASLEDSLLEAAGNNSKLVLVLNFPSNPTGFSPSQKEVDEIADVLKGVVAKTGKTLVVLLDDAYEGYVFSDSGVKQSVFADLFGLDEKIVLAKIDGVSKEFSFYGGRVGCITFAAHPRWLQGEDKKPFFAELETKFGAFVRSTVSNSTRCVQAFVEKVISGGLEKALAERERLFGVLRERYEVMVSEVKKLGLKRISADPFNSGFFCFLNLEDVSATKLADHLLVRYKTGVIPIEKKGINGIRVAYCSVKKEDIPLLMRNISQAVRDLG